MQNAEDSNQKYALDEYRGRHSRQDENKDDLENQRRRIHFFECWNIEHLPVFFILFRCQFLKVQSTDKKQKDIGSTKHEKSNTISNSNLQQQQQSATATAI